MWWLTVRTTKRTKKKCVRAIEKAYKWKMRFSSARCNQCWCLFVSWSRNEEASKEASFINIRRCIFTCRLSTQKFSVPRRRSKWRFTWHKSQHSRFERKASQNGKYYSKIPHCFHTESIAVNQNVGRFVKLHAADIATTCATLVRIAIRSVSFFEILKLPNDTESWSVNAVRQAESKRNPIMVKH